MKTETGNRPYVIVRAYPSDVYAGYLEFQNATNATYVVLTDCRRLWRWGADSLSEVATYGPSLKGENKFDARVARLMIVSPQGLEITECTEEARKAIEAIPEWR
jgi:hypothetical protein